jgi:hypothetical protein
MFFIHLDTEEVRQEVAKYSRFGWKEMTSVFFV